MILKRSETLPYIHLGITDFFRSAKTTKLKNVAPAVLVIFFTRIKKPSLKSRSGFVLVTSVSWSWPPRTPRRQSSKQDLSLDSDVSMNKWEVSSPLPTMIAKLTSGVINLKVEISYFQFGQICKTGPVSYSYSYSDFQVKITNFLPAIWWYLKL